jgi:hypothetical protein
LGVGALLLSWFASQMDLRVEQTAATCHQVRTIQLRLHPNPPACLLASVCTMMVTQACCRGVHGKLMMHVITLLLLCEPQVAL